MTRPRTILAPLAVALGLAARAVRRVARPLLVLAVVPGGSALVGRWPTAVVSAVVFMVWLLRRWVAIEDRLDARTRRPVDVDGYMAKYRAKARPATGGPRDAGGGEHVAIARALVAVSACYLARCEDQTDTHTRTGPGGWR